MAWLPAPLKALPETAGGILVPLTLHSAQPGHHAALSTPVLALPASVVMLLPPGSPFLPALPPGLPSFTWASCSMMALVYLYFLYDNWIPKVETEAARPKYYDKYGPVKGRTRNRGKKNDMPGIPAPLQRWAFAMLARLVSNSLPQVIRLPQPPKSLKGSQVKQLEWRRSKEVCNQLLGDSQQRSHTGRQHDSFGRCGCFASAPAWRFSVWSVRTDGLGWSHPHKENSNWKR
ncbi:hypothetical protein AAY473_034185 [Plecturocebus cupreus]